MSENCYVYCDGILGVKTNIPRFKWIYGSVAPSATRDEYESCDVKFEIDLMPESRLPNNAGDDSFQSYSWNREQETISCRRTFLKNIQIGYNITLLNEHRVIAKIGRNYYKLVKNRVMNLHSAYYLLSDLANMLLLKSGYLTLYASAVHFSPQNKGIVCFAAPNTGKTLTAMKLCEKEGYRLIGEDVVIVKGRELHACPWTSSYRKEKSKVDTAGTFRRNNGLYIGQICEACEITDVVVLTAGKRNEASGQAEVLRLISILNGYLFHYYASPIVKILGYFDPRYAEEWDLYTQKLLKQFADSCTCHVVRAHDPLAYGELVHGLVIGGDGKDI